jgi:hypothetical protein
MGANDELRDDEGDDRTAPTAAERWEEVVDQLDRKSRLVVQVLEPTGSLDDGVDNPRLRRLAPADVDEARHRLALVIDEQVRRIEQLRAERAGVVDANDSEAAARLASKTGRDADLERHYVHSHRRGLIGTLDAFYKYRKAVDVGTVDEVNPGQDDHPGLSSAGPSVTETAGSGHAAPTPPQPQEPPPEVTPPHARESEPNGSHGYRANSPVIAQFLARSLYEDYPCVNPTVWRNEPKKSEKYNKGPPRAKPTAKKRSVGFLAVAALGSAN